jgi:outer membrane lipoprotein carrier protein
VRSSCARRTRNSLRVLIAALALSLAAADTVDDAAKTLDAVQKRYDSVRDIRAHFAQKSFAAALGKETESRGSVTVQRPGKMRWEYAQPDGRVIVLDEKSIRIWNPEEKQLQIAKLNQSNVSPTALGFLMGQGVLKDTFTAEAIAAPERAERGVRLRPKSDASFESLELWVDPKTFQLRESIVQDLFGNRTSVRLDGIAENQGVAASVFTFEAPEGAEVVDLR